MPLFAPVTTATRGIIRCADGNVAMLEGKMIVVGDDDLLTRSMEDLPTFSSQSEDCHTNRA